MKRIFIPVLIAFALSSCSDETDLEEDSMGVSDSEKVKSEPKKSENVAVRAVHKAPPKRQEVKKEEEAKRDVFSIKSVLGKRKNKQKSKPSKLSKKERKIQLENVRKAREEAKERRKKSRAASGVNPYAKRTYR